ncbi:unnamed protein product [Trichobilharzia regenti]|nr:unnamed protein product [Trichobilharzia regenti]
MNISSSIPSAASIRSLHIREMKFKDKRMKCLGEVLSAIRVVKLYAWEKAFQSQVRSIRKSELVELLRVALVSIRRVGIFLLSDELEQYSLDKSPHSSGIDYCEYGVGDALKASLIFSVFKERHTLYLLMTLCLLFSDSSDAITFENASFSWTKRGPLVLKK